MAEEKCIALCDFASNQPDELSFSKGDVITVLAKGKDSGYWEGSLDGRRGLFPNCFVSSNMHPTRAPTFLDKAIALFAYKPTLPTEMPIQKHDIISVVRQGNSPGWWYGVNESERQRRAAAAGVDGAALPVATEQEALLFPSNYVSCNLVRAIYVFKARQRCELSIYPGDIILVHRRWNDGWWEGSIPAALDRQQHDLSSAPSGVGTSSSGGGGGFVVGGMRRGIFPSNYTTSNVPTTTPPLFCPKCRTVFQPKTTACKECGRNEEIVKTILTTLEDYEKGLLAAPAGTGDQAPPPLDLFALVDVDPAKGKGALLNPADAKEATVRPRLAV